MQVASIVIRDRYHPSVIVATCGTPIRLNFTRDEEDPCSEKVIFPDFGSSRSLPAHRTTTVVLTPERKGEYLFTCAMGMYQGIVVVRGRCTRNGGNCVRTALRPIRSSFSAQSNSPILLLA